MKNVEVTKLWTSEGFERLLHDTGSICRQNAQFHVEALNVPPLQLFIS